MVEKYSPSNGTEGMVFTAKFCDQCIHDAKYRETMEGEHGCPIITLALIYDVTDEQYPNQWCYDDDGKPTCTAFEKEAVL